MNPDDLKKELENLTKNSSLFEIQQYINHMVKVRHFDNDNPTNLMLFLTEELGELGELGKEVRKREKLKVDVDKETKVDVEGEIVDVFIYLLSLCRVLDIDLLEAFQKKERINSSRTWE